MLAILLFALGLAHSWWSGSALWAAIRRHGGMTSMAMIKNGLAVAQFYHNRVLIERNGKINSFTFPHPIQVIPDGRGGGYVLSLLFGEVGRITPEGELERNFSLSGDWVAAAVLSEESGVWLAGYDKGRSGEEPKKIFYFPEYHKHKWFLEFVKGDLYQQEHRPTKAYIFDNEIWHEESGGLWQMLAMRENIYVINDLAESIHCLDRQSGRLVWRAATLSRPTAAAVWGDRLLVCSAQAGAVSAYRLDDGGKLWQSSLGRGLSAMTIFEGNAVLSNRIADRIYSIDPMNGNMVNEIEMGGAPNSMLINGEELWVGLDSTSEVVRLNRHLKEIGRRTFSVEESQ